MQSDQGLHFPLTESLEITEYIKCQDGTLGMRGMNLNLCILRMLEDTFLLGVTHMMVRENFDQGWLIYRSV